MFRQKRAAAFRQTMPPLSGRQQTGPCNGEMSNIVHATVRKLYAFSGAAFLLALAPLAARAQQSWPQFRGPLGAGIRRGRTAAGVERAEKHRLANAARRQGLVQPRRRGRADLAHLGGGRRPQPASAGVRRIHRRATRRRRGFSRPTAWRDPSLQFVRHADAGARRRCGVRPLRAPTARRG